MAISSTDGWGTAPFAKPESIALLWEYIRYFIGQYMPFIMIVVALFVVWAVTAIGISIFEKKGYDKDEDDPVEYL